MVSGRSTRTAITTPTKEWGNPAAETAASIAGDSIFASPTTATSAPINTPALPSALRLRGLVTWCGTCVPVTESGATTGTKKSRCRTVWVSTNNPYNNSEAQAAKTNCEAAYSGPGSLTVKFGKTMVSAASVVTQARAAPLPSGWKRVVPYRTEPTSSDNPTIPFIVIIAAAKTVSRASDEASWLPESIMITMRPTSITVTAIASTRDPNGSPMRAATTSA